MPTPRPQPVYALPPLCTLTHSPAGPGWALVPSGERGVTGDCRDLFLFLRQLLGPRPGLPTSPLPLAGPPGFQVPGTPEPSRFLPRARRALASWVSWAPWPRALSGADPLGLGSPEPLPTRPGGHLSRAPAVPARCVARVLAGTPPAGARRVAPGPRRPQRPVTVGQEAKGLCPGRQPCHQNVRGAQAPPLRPCPRPQPPASSSPAARYRRGN